MFTAERVSLRARMTFCHRTNGLLLALFLCVAAGFPATALAQWKTDADAKAIAADGFPPLDKWKAAVLAGDRAALAALYSSTQGTFTQTPQGRSNDPNEEPDYWTKVRAAGLQSINPKILQVKAPQPGAIVLVLRIDLTMRVQGETRQAIVSASQLWVQQGNGWYIYRSQRTDAVPRPPMRLPEPARPNPELYPEPAEAHKDLDAALAAARKDHKRVLVVFGANWCYDCHVLDSTFRSKTIQPLVAAGYHVVHVNVGDGTENTDLARRCEVPSDKLPSLAVLDADGRLVTSQKNGEFDNAVRIGMGDVSEFLEKWKPTAGK